MEKQKRWQFYLIMTVIVLTLYNILPTIFYYSKPLKSPVDAKAAEVVAENIVERVNSVEQDSKEWLVSFSHLLGIKPQSIELNKNDPGLFEVTFANAKDADIFKRFLPRAGSLIPFVPAQLKLYPAGAATATPNTVLIARKIDVALEPADINTLFHFSPKYAENGELAPLYRDIVYDRATQIALGFSGPSKGAMQLSLIAENPADAQYDELVLTVAKEILDAEKVLGKSSPIAQRYFARFSQVEGQNDLISKFVARAETLKLNVTVQRDALIKEQKQLKDSGELQDSAKDQLIAVYENQRQILENAISFVQKNNSLFNGKLAPLSADEIHAALVKNTPKSESLEKLQVLDLQGRNPFVQSLVIDWSNDRILTKFYPEVDALRLGNDKTEETAFLKDKVNQYIINDIAYAATFSDESIVPFEDNFGTTLSTLTNSQSLLTLDLGSLANKASRQIAHQLNASWTTSHPDLTRENYPVHTYDEYQKLSSEDQKLGLVVYAPAMYEATPPMGFRSGSIYVIARGLDAILQKYRQAPEAPENAELNAEITQLNRILQQKGFIGYSGSSYGIDPSFKKDFIYELDDFYSNLLKATREDFVVKGSKRYATLDFTDVEQRILTTNKIEDGIQEDLIKAKEEYNIAQVDLNATTKYQVPAPTKNVYWENLKLSAKKYFRGDDRKILKWGLDLSGGKTVRIGLRDRNNRQVTNPDDIRQAVNELYTRINNMGVSERTIHVEGNNIILDFPGSQNLSAAELIKASAMYFHFVNEKFTPTNPALKDSVNQFLQEVWNEAVVTNRKDIESINMIAYQHLGADRAEQGIRPLGDDAQELYNNGLRLANPKDSVASHAFNDTLSSIAVMRGDSFAEWHGQSHPLMIVFHNFALEGANLTNVQVGYDASEGNILTFGVKGSYDGAVPGNPREDFYAWTSQFAEDKIVGTAKEEPTQGRGWRMAVILNDQLITMPALRQPLRDGGTIMGRFSQREVSQLAADLKAGSLSFTPRILSEENVSPELGQEERKQGIIASTVALALVVAAMIGYYHFAGIVASCAVLFNILIMWGVLQNLGAALTLPGIAGIVLTIGMAVDANVLVFERIREEFSATGRIASAIQAGYRKAFSAIIDSNITTIIAALILVQFDSGPIKGFAVTLIIGIISSMFTALFMTRYFFAGWVQNPEHKSLTMSQFIGKTKFDFLAQAKKAFIASLVLMLIGGYFFFAQGKSLLGMDFTGGYSLNVEFVEKAGNPSYRLEAADALMTHGATSNDFQIRELSKPNQLRIQLGTGMEEKGHPFYQMPESLKEGKFDYEYQKNPRIEWVVKTLEEANLQIVPSQLANLDNNWTSISGQLSDAMRNNALIGLGIALLSILIYITFRFEFKFAIAAVIGLVHDVIITLGILAILHKLGFAVQIDLQVVGAIMTIIGYSLNDTIIVFDRIREDMHVMRKMSFSEIINHALNVTLSRTIMTSGTTLLVLLALVLLGGKSIFAFSLVMAIGVIVGTASSLFIAAPVLLYFHNREIKQQEEKAAIRKA